MRVATAIVQDILTATQMTGASVAAVLSRAGVAMAQLEGPWVEGPEAMAIWRAALAEAPVNDLPLRVGQLPNLGVLGPVGFALLAAPNLGAALELIVRYAPLMGDMMTYHYRARGKEGAFLAVPHPAWCATDATTAAAAVAAAMSTAHTLTSLLAGQPVRPLRIELRDALLPATAWMPVVGLQPAAAAHNAVVWAAADLARPLPSADAVALAQARQRCDVLLAHLSMGTDLLAQVQDALAAWDWQQAPRLPAVARQMGYSVRHLQRALATRHTTWQTVVTEARLARAEHWLRHSPLPVAEIAYRLGFAAPEVLTRFFQRHRGMSPLAYRQGQA